MLFIAALNFNLMISPSFLKTFALLHLEPLLNKALPLAPNAEALLKPLNKTTIGFDITAPKLGFTLAFTDHSIHLLPDFEPEANASLKITGLSLIQLLFRPHLPNVQHSITLNGQVSLLQAFMQLLQQIDLQWEEALTPYLGDTVSEMFGQFSRTGWRWGSKAIGTLLENVQDHFNYDSKLVVSPMEQTDFFQAIERLSTETERAEQRLSQLTAQLSRQTVIKTPVTHITQPET